MGQVYVGAAGGGITPLDLYPIGSIYQTTDQSFDPGAMWGGTWERIKGRVVVGADEGDVDFAQATATGGEKSHLLTEAEMPTHMHAQTMNWGSRGAGEYLSWLASPKGGSSHGGYFQSGGSYVSGTGIAALYTSNAGNGKEHNNMPPYYIAYIWRRIA